MGGARPRCSPRRQVEVVAPTLIHSGYRAVQLEGPGSAHFRWGRASNELAYMAQRVHHLWAYRLSLDVSPASPRRRPCDGGSSAPSAEYAVGRAGGVGPAVWGSVGTNGERRGCAGRVRGARRSQRHSVELGLFELDPLPSESPASSARDRPRRDGYIPGSLLGWHSSAWSASASRVPVRGLRTLVLRRLPGYLEATAWSIRRRELG